ncbi:MAG: terpene cyclase/mutase family protein [Acidobacteriia bacterium]|nr:terpene cyclase/mutase family protein [Terriglobia bacterium]
MAEGPRELRDPAGFPSLAAGHELARIPQLKPRDNQEAIAAGLDFLFASHRSQHWTDFCRLPEHSDAWVTAYVLASLAEIPAGYLGFTGRQRLQESLEWLLDIQGSDGGWGFNVRAESDAESTAWVVKALHGHHRAFHESAIRLIERCRRPDGGFGAFAPESPSGRAWTLGSPDVTAVVISAFGGSDPLAADFLRSCWLQTNRPLPAFRIQSRFYTCALVLEWEEPEGSWPVLEKLCELMSWNKADNAFDQALLLRCLTRLQIQKSGSVAAGLRRLQRFDGSWPASASLTLAPGRGSDSEPAGDDKRIVSTAAAVSALARYESTSSSIAGAFVSPAKIGGW